MSKIAKNIFVGLICICPTYLFAAWDVGVSKDEMTGKKKSYATSSMVKSTKPMGFPYKGVKSWLGIGCNNESTWVYAGFTSSPNLSGDKTKSGFNEIKTRIKWDDDVEKTTLTQTWGAKALHFNNDDMVIKRIVKANSVLLELNWHGNGPTYFNYSLNGSSKAIKKLAKECGFKLNKITFEDSFKIKAREEAPYDWYQTSVDGNVVTAKTEGSSWKPYARDIAAKGRISKTMRIVDSVASKINDNYSMTVNVWGSTSKQKAASDGGYPFSGSELKHILDKVISKNLKLKERIKEIIIREEKPVLYTEDDGYPILVGRVKKTNERIEMHVYTD